MLLDGLVKNYLFELLTLAVRWILEVLVDISDVVCSELIVDWCLFALDLRFVLEVVLDILCRCCDIISSHVMASSSLFSDNILDF